MSSTSCSDHLLNRKGRYDLIKENADKQYGKGNYTIQRHGNGFNTTYTVIPT